MSKKEIVEQQQDWVADPQNTLIALDKQANANIQALAHQLGYDGSLTVGALEDEIRFYQRRTVEACLELGKRLLLLKEMSQHGEFRQRLELMGFSERTAQRFMQAALKTSKSANLAVLAKQSANPSKFLELITLDDEELTELTEGGSARGITLDNISTMSVTELRKALRQTTAEKESYERLCGEKDQKLNEQHAELIQRNQPNPNNYLLEQQEKERNAMNVIHDTTNIALAAVQRFHHDILSVAELAEIGNVGEEINNAIHFIYQRIAQTSLELGIQVDFENIVNPSWATPLAEDE